MNSHNLVIDRVVDHFSIAEKCCGLFNEMNYQYSCSTHVEAVYYHNFHTTELICSGLVYKKCSPCAVGKITDTEHAYWNIIPTLCAIDRNLELGAAYCINGYIRIMSMHKCVYDIIFDKD